MLWARAELRPPSLQRWLAGLSRTTPQDRDFLVELAQRVSSILDHENRSTIRREIQPRETQNAEWRALSGMAGERRGASDRADPPCIPRQGAQQCRLLEPSLQASECGSLGWLVSSRQSLPRLVRLESWPG